MLVLGTKKDAEEVIIHRNGEILCRIKCLYGPRVRLGFTASPDILIHREGPFAELFPEMARPRADLDVQSVAETNIHTEERT